MQIIYSRDIHCLPLSFGCTPPSSLVPSHPTTPAAVPTQLGAQQDEEREMDYDEPTPALPRHSARIPKPSHKLLESRGDTLYASLITLFIDYDIQALFAGEDGPHSLPKSVFEALSSPE
jgi:hypothetical protein